MENNKEKIEEIKNKNDEISNVSNDFDKETSEEILNQNEKQENVTEESSCEKLEKENVDLTRIEIPNTCQYQEQAKNMQNNDNVHFAQTSQNMQFNQQVPPIQSIQPIQQVEKIKKDKTPKGIKIVIGICIIWSIVLLVLTILGIVFIPKAIKKENGTNIVNKNEIIENIIGDKLNENKDKENKENVVIEKTEVFDNYNTSMNDVSTIVENVMPSMVSITTTATVEYINPFFGGYIGEYEAEGAGSGIIISQTDEYLSILTNEHVVSGANSVEVGFIDNTKVEGVIKSSDYNSDLAIVIVEIEKVSLETLESIKVATLGDSNELKLGQNVIAIGNSLGYGQTVTSGIISALDRKVTSDDGITRTFIQTDAAINPGNSGGALLNMNGEVIGINESKIAASEIEGVGFAIPISNATDIIEKLSNREYRKVVEETERGYLGISCIDVDAAVAQTYRMPTGVFVYDIAPNSSAEKAGIKAGDIIITFDGVEVTTSNGLVDLVSRYKVGEKVEVVLQRAENGEYIEKTIEVELLEKQYDFEDENVILDSSKE